MTKLIIVFMRCFLFDSFCGGCSITGFVLRIGEVLLFIWWIVCLFSWGLLMISVVLFIYASCRSLFVAGLDNWKLMTFNQFCLLILLSGGNFKTSSFISSYQGIYPHGWFFLRMFDPKKENSFVTSSSLSFSSTDSWNYWSL